MTVDKKKLPIGFFRISSEPTTRSAWWPAMRLSKKERIQRGFEWWRSAR